MSLLAVSGEGPTPRTPEILNSLMSMTNPFEVRQQASGESVCGGGGGDRPAVPPVQHTRSRLIKEGLKLTLQTRRRRVVKSPPPPDYSPLTPTGDQLTPEDEERRRRRRERNKIAATKCRLKKREKTFNLVHESEILETQNMDLKSQIHDLENEKRQLVDMLNLHRSSCAKGVAYQEPYPVQGQYEISCQTRISYEETTYRYDHQACHRYSPTSYRPQEYPRTSSISTSSSDFDSLKDVDSPSVTTAQYHHFDEETDAYIPSYHMSTVTHS